MRYLTRPLLIILALLFFAPDADAHRGRQRRKARRVRRRSHASLVVPVQIVPPLMQKVK